MATKVHMEALSPTMEEGQLVRWLKQEGDAVQEGDILAEIETDKATMELVARGSGVLKGVSLEEGATAPVGQVIAHIVAEGEEVPAGGGEKAAEAPAEPEAAAEPEEEGAPAKPAADASAKPAKGKPARAARQQPDPRGADDRAAGPGYAEEEPEQREHMMHAAADDDDDDAGGSAGPARGGQPAPARSAGERVKASPLARRLASEAGIELSGVTGSGPGGRITKRDVEQASEDGGPAGGAPAPSVAAGGYDGPDVEEIPVSQMRKAIAKRLVTSIGPVPTFYLTIEVDMVRLMDARERVNERLEKENIKLSINDFIIKAVAAALAKHPEVNAAWAESVIQRHHRVHIGVAVAVDEGLITPIVRDADRKAVRDIAAEVRELAGRAREKKLKPEEYTGATFSISNLGMFGIQEFTAIINPPEAAILAVGAVEEKVVAEDGQIEVRPRMRLTMSCDHRVVDGAMGAKFLQTVRDYLEEPLMILA